MKEIKLTAKTFVENQIIKHSGELEIGQTVNIEYGKYAETTIRRAIRNLGFASRTDICGNIYAKKVA